MDRLELLKRQIRAHALVNASPERKIVERATGLPKIDKTWLFDFRAIILQPEPLNAFAELFWERFEKSLPFQVGGPETVGIALTAAIVMKGIERGTPVNGFYVRKSRKRDGLMQVIEGTLTTEPIILVDDIINSAATLNKHVKILEAEGYDVRDLFTILSFRDKSAYAFAEEAGISISWLYDLRDFGLTLKTGDERALPHASLDQQWKFSAGEPSHHHVVQKSAPVLDESRVYFGSDNGTFWALDQETGSVAWNYKTGRHPRGKGIFSTPVVYDGRVYFGAYDGNVYALDAKTGALVWKNDEADWIGSSPSIAPDKKLLFVGLEFGLLRKRGGIAAIDLVSGKTVWTARTTEYTHGSPLYIPEVSAVVIGSNDSIAYCYDAQTGAERWRFQASGEFKSRFTYDATTRLVYGGSFDGTLYALSVRDGSIVWVHKTDAGIYSIPLIIGDLVYVTSLDKTIRAIDKQTGRLQWTFETNGRIFASPTYADSSIWIGSNDGRLYELDKDTGALKTSLQCTEKIVNAICFRAGRFFVPTCANELYCLRRAPR